MLAIDKSIPAANAILSAIASTDIKAVPFSTNDDGNCKNNYQ